MTQPNKKLAEALRILKHLQDKYKGVIEGSDLKKSHRTTLVEEGFLRQIIKGWYWCADPRVQGSGSTAWYASFWSFLSGYLNRRFGKHYCLNVETSLLLHTRSTIVPRQVIAVVKEGGTSVLHLPHDTSLLIYTDEKNFPHNRIEKDGLQVLPLPEVLCKLGPQFFRNNPREVEIALNMVRDVGELLSVLLAKDGMVTAAARLAGALRFVGRADDADRIVHTMKLAKYGVREVNPFTLVTPTLGNNRERSPYVMRLQSMWKGWREAVLSVFPPPPSLAQSAANYLIQMNERYGTDAYNSLSIEGYQISDALIERVAKRGWNPEINKQDNKDREALVARGYYQAFQSIKISIAAILSGENPGAVVRKAHHRWYSELFAPAVAAGIIEPYQLAGYRNGPVYIRHSMHTPVPKDALVDAMEVFFNLLEQETEPAVSAVLGHHLFVFIHPYFDGNGRLGRFLMNAMLASGGYPWTVIHVKRRSAYFAALENASVGGDIKPLARFIVEEMRGDLIKLS